LIKQVSGINFTIAHFLFYLQKKSKELKSSDIKLSHNFFDVRAELPFKKIFTKFGK